MVSACFNSFVMCLMHDHKKATLLHVLLNVIDLVTCYKHSACFNSFVMCLMHDHKKATLLHVLLNVIDLVTCYKHVFE